MRKVFRVLAWLLVLCFFIAAWWYFFLTAGS